MNPVGLPMLHLIAWRGLGMGKFRLHQHSDRRLGDVGLLAASDSEYALELVRENFDEARGGIAPIVENRLGARAGSQYQVTGDQVADDLDILRIEQWLKINRIKIAALLGEVPALVEHVSNTAAHAGRKI